MTAAELLLRIHDLDLLALELGDATYAAKLRRLGLEVAPAQGIESRRAELVAALDARWRQHYERALKRYGSGVAAVRGRVCQGCFMTLPRGAGAFMVDGVSSCEACGRILFWGARTAVDSN
jgi:predicted  nucleic acid-binding Zn-ribbon protein